MKRTLIHAAARGSPGMPPPRRSGEDEAELFRRVAQRDEGALADIVEEHWSPLVARIGLVAPDPAMAEDIVQEAFLRFWRREPPWVPTAPIGAILFRIAKNLALNEQAAASVRRAALPRLRLLGADPATPLDELECQDLQTAVDAAIGALPARRQAVFRMVRFEGLTYLEVAALMRTSPQTVANQMSAALTSLRHSLARFIDSR